MHRPLVSVIIPTHNRASSLQEALRSVYAQEGIGEEFRLEVLVVDDASTDGTPDLVREFPGVRYIRQPGNQGAAAARNAGIKSSGGVLVAFLDDDDLWLPHKLRLQVAALEARADAEVAYGQCIFAFLDYARGQPDPRQAPSGSVFGPLLMHNFISVSTVVVRRRTLEETGYFDESLNSGEDYDMWLRLALRCRFAFVEGPLAIYRRAPEGKYAAYLTRTGGGSLRRVVEKALAMVPDTARYKDLRRAARASLEVRIAADLEDLRRGESGGPRAWAGPRGWLRRLSAERWLRVVLCLGARLWDDRVDRPNVSAGNHTAPRIPGRLRTRALFWSLLLASRILEPRNRRVALAHSQTASGEPTTADLSIRPPALPRPREIQTCDKRRSSTRVRPRVP